MNAPEPTKEEKGERSRFRVLTGKMEKGTRVGLFVACLAPFLYVLRISDYLGLFFFPQQVSAVVLGLMLSLSFLLVPARPGRETDSRVPSYDFLFSFLSLVGAGYIAVLYPSIIVRVTGVPFYEYILGIITVLLVFESVRRQAGWPIVIIAAFFIFHTIFSNYFPGVFYGKGYPWLSLVQVFYTFDDGIYGVVLRIMTTVVILFVLFGGAIVRSGGSRVIMDTSMALTGRFRGGPAKGAAVSSAAFGSISGSAAANVAVTGVITIPLMKKIGYSPVYAGAVEAAASSAGILTPPVMGTVVFIMAEYLEIGYGKIIVASFLPVLLYYTALIAQVDLQAGKLGLRGLPRSELPPFWPSLRAGWWIFPPFVVLLLSLVVYYLPVDLAGLYALLCLVFLSLFRREGKLGPKNLFLNFESASRSMLMVVPVGALAGIIIGSTTMSGLGANISTVLVSISAGNQMVLLLLTAVTCIILGMGMPPTATYIMLVILIAPALVQTGITPLAIHLFIFYFAALSHITPPVCVAAYVASGIAGASPFRIGFQAMRLAIIVIIIPFVFVFKPALLMAGPFFEILITFVSAAIGALVLAVTLEGYLFRQVHWLWRILLGATGMALISGYHWLQVSGVIVTALFLIRELKARKEFEISRTPERTSP